MNGKTLNHRLPTCCREAGIFTLVYTNPDLVRVTIYEKEEDAIEELLKQAKEEGMFIYDTATLETLDGSSKVPYANGDETYLLIEKHIIK